MGSRDRAIKDRMDTRDRLLERAGIVEEPVTAGEPDTVSGSVSTPLPVKPTEPYSGPAIPLVGRNGELKTRQMLLIELEWHLPIEEVLMCGTLEEVASLLGLDDSTISKWRKRLGLRG